MIWTSLTAAAALIWLAIFLLPWRPWRIREVLEAQPASCGRDLSDVTVLIPARNEEKVIGNALKATASQGPGLRIVLVDDQSTDMTVATAQRSGVQGLQIIRGAPAPAGWSGKLWALEQGQAYVRTPLILLMDADIELQPCVLPALIDKMSRTNVRLVSLMAALRMESFWERCLIPAFIYFFKMVYPFGRANRAGSGVAAAAGGCILLQRELLEKIGGFQPLRHALIDDCALAKQVKSHGHGIWIGLTRSVRSLRAYDTVTPIWNMVARTAYTQLRHSVLLLMLVTALMVVMFGVPLLGFFSPVPLARLLAAAAWATMSLSFIPTLRFYGVSYAWALAMPGIGLFYLAMTWTSAVRFWRGEGAAWKGRRYFNR